MVAVEALAAETADGGPALLIGSLWCEEGKVYNAALLLDAGKVLAVRLKHDLPNYGVFDEKRYFSQGKASSIFTLKGINVGLSICEDIWRPEPAAAAVTNGAQLIIARQNQCLSLWQRSPQRLHAMLDTGRQLIEAFRQSCFCRTVKINDLSTCEAGLPSVHQVLC